MVITLRMRSHFNFGGGRGASTSSVVVDGVETQILLKSETRRRGLYSTRYLEAPNGEQLDIMAGSSTTFGEIEEWVTARLNPAANTAAR